MVSRGVFVLFQYSVGDALEMPLYLYARTKAQAVFQYSVGDAHRGPHSQFFRVFLRGKLSILRWRCDANAVPMVHRQHTAPLSILRWRCHRRHRQRLRVVLHDFQYSVGDAGFPLRREATPREAGSFQYSVGDARICMESRWVVGSSPNLSILRWRCRDV